MSVTKQNIFRIFHMIGLLLGVISLFMEWYYFQAFDFSNELWVDWSYHLFRGWFSASDLRTTFNDYYKPVNGDVPLLIPILFIIFIALSLYTVSIKDAESSDLSQIGRYAFFNLGFVLFLSFFIVIFPIVYLLPNQLLYPNFSWYNLDLELMFTYVIGPGYLLQVFALMCSVPYTLLYYHIVRTYEAELNSSALSRQLSKSQTKLDLDKLIAEEELKLSAVNSKEEDHVEQVYQKFLTIKKRRN